MATGTRAIYYTVLSYIPAKWADILLNVYYPALLSAFSLLICFWAEVSVMSCGCGGRGGCCLFCCLRQNNNFHTSQFHFLQVGGTKLCLVKLFHYTCLHTQYFYHSSPVDGRHFLRKYKYSVTFLIFNVTVCLLLIANIVATPLISDQEQLRMTGIINIIFAFLFFVTLVGFLHFAIRLFFRVSCYNHSNASF